MSKVKNCVKFTFSGFTSTQFSSNAFAHLHIISTHIYLLGEGGRQGGALVHLQELDHVLVRPGVRLQVRVPPVWGGVALKKKEALQNKPDRPDKRQQKQQTRPEAKMSRKKSHNVEEKTTIHKQRGNLKYCLIDRV